MVRTKADSGARKAVAAKAPRKQVGNSSQGGSSSSSPKTPTGSSKGGPRGNPLRKCPTPAWQKGVGDFFSKRDSSEDVPSQSSDSDQEGASSSLSGSQDHQEPCQSTSNARDSESEED